MEDYAAKMALKPDADLREYVTGHAQYREGAVLAALDELRRRGLPAPEDATLRPALEAAVQAQAAEAEASRLSSRNNTSNDTAVDTVPHPLHQLAVLLPLRATPSPRPHLPPITARDLDLPAITTVLRSLKTNVHLPSHHLRTLTLTAVRHYGLYSWP